MIAGQWVWLVLAVVVLRAPSVDRLQVVESQKRAHKKIAEMRIPRQGGVKQLY